MNRLHISEITSIGAVESGDDPEATILLYKSKQTPEPGQGPVEKEGSMSFDIESLTDEGKEYVSELETRLAALSEETPAALPDDLDPVVKARLDAQDETMEKDRVEKESLAKQVAELRDGIATEKWTARATELAPLFGDEDTAEVLKELDAAAPGPFGKLNAMFDTAVSVVKSSPLFKEIGDSSATGSAEDQITVHATEIRKNNPELSMVAARAQAWTEHPDLKAQSREEA